MRHHEGVASRRLPVSTQADVGVPGIQYMLGDTLHGVLINPLLAVQHLRMSCQTMYHVKPIRAHMLSLVDMDLFSCLEMELSRAFDKIVIVHAAAPIF